MNTLVRILIDVVVVLVAFWLIALLPLPYPIDPILKAIVVILALVDVVGTLQGRTYFRF